MKIIGLTGGIGCGKSTASQYLLEKGYTVIDADKIAKELVEIGSDILLSLTEVFGKKVLNKDKGLDRKELARMVFSSVEQKKKLDDIMLVEILKNIDLRLEQYEKSGEQMVIIDAPLLFESGLFSRCHEIWVVDVADETRIQRVMNRDKVTAEDVMARINNQMSSEEKKLRATVVLNNSRTPKELYEQIDNLLNKERMQ